MLCTASQAKNVSLAIPMVNDQEEKAWSKHVVLCTGGLMTQHPFSHRSLSGSSLPVWPPKKTSSGLSSAPTGLLSFAFIIFLDFHVN